MRVHLKNVEKWAPDQIEAYFPHVRRSMVRQVNASQSSDHRVTEDARSGVDEHHGQQVEESSNDEELVHASEVNKPGSEPPITQHNNAHYLAQQVSKRFSCPDAFCDYSADRLCDFKRHLAGKSHNLPNDIARAYWLPITPWKNLQLDVQDREYLNVNEEQVEELIVLVPNNSDDNHDYRAHINLPMQICNDSASGSSFGTKVVKFHPPIPKVYMGINLQVRNSSANSEEMSGVQVPKKIKYDLSPRE